MFLSDSYVVDRYDFNNYSCGGQIRFHLLVMLQVCMFSSTSHVVYMHVFT